ncbi:MAG: SLBB domain-containing protein [Spirochaetaceae bacterium]|jgi:electron transport complex protein RnfC|nr:SLBB domain-containing protein [Spirochaetaceae bacterium]
MKVFSFPKGGINFEDSFAPEKEHSRLAFLPEIVVIPLSTESGARAYPVARVGRHIEEGMLIARGQGAGSSNIHSPIPGKLIKMVKWEPASFLSDAFVIRLEGSFKKLGKPETKYTWTELSRFETISLIRDKGVTEMDGLGRPLFDIFSKHDTARERITLLVRCVFDDPWLAADYCLCKERAGAIGEGALIAAKAAGADSVVFAVSAASKELVNVLLDAVNRCETAGQFRVSAFLTGSRYPQQNDFELCSVFRKYEKYENTPAGKPVILGPATIAAVYDAVVLRSPPLERYVAVGGSAVKHPTVVKVRIGSRLRDLFAECGGFRGKAETRPESVFTAIGSPLMGRAANLDEPVLKTSRGVFAYAQKKREAALNFFPALKNIAKLLPAAVCISCGECRNVCPAGLDPEDVYKRIKDGRHDDAMIPLVSRCIGCGCCETVCPSKLPICANIMRSTFKGADCAG